MSPRFVAPMFLAAAAVAACGGRGGAAEPPETPRAEGREDGSATAEEDGEDARIRAVQEAVNAHRGAVHACWGQAAARSLDVEGDVVLEVEIGEGGTPDAVEILRDTAENEVLSSCLVELWEGHEWPEGSFAKGEVVQLPPFRFVAPERQFAVASADVDERELAGGAAVARVVMHEENSGNGAASLTRLWIDEGEELVLPTRSEAATAAFALAGEGRAHGPGLAGAGAAFGAQDALYASPGTPLRLRAAGGSEPLELVVAYAPGGPEAEFLDGAAGDVEKERGGEGEISIRRAGDAQSYSLAAGLGEVAIYLEEASVGEDSASLSLLTAGPKMVVPRHTHDASEYLLILSGAGTMGAGEESFEVGPGTAVQVPSGIEHDFEVGADDTVRALQIYAPAGPEQRFKDD